MSDLSFGLLFFIAGVLVTLWVEWVLLLVAQVWRWRELREDPDEDGFWEV